MGPQGEGPNLFKEMYSEFHDLISKQSPKVAVSCSSMDVNILALYG